jgi:hypothetical protein
METKSYLDELRGQVRGNARLRRKLNASKRDNVRYRYQIAMLVTLLDRVGLGDHPQTKSAANSIGWGRAK